MHQSVCATKIELILADGFMTFKQQVQVYLTKLFGHV